MAADRRRRADKAGAEVEVEALVKADPLLIQVAWYHLQGWYKAPVDRLHGPGLSAERTPDGDEAIPGREEMVVGEATGKTNEDR